MLTLKLASKAIPPLLAESYLNSISYLISLKTTISYFPAKAVGNKLSVNVDKDRMTMDDAITELKDILNSDKFSKQFKRLYRILDTRGYEPNKMMINKQVFTFKPPSNIDIHVKEITNEYGDKLTLIADPLIKNAASVINISVSHKEIDFGWNYLHLFEHICCIDAIEDYERLDAVNGYTLPTGISTVYAEVLDANAAAQMMKTMQKIWNSSRNGNLVKDYKLKIQREIERTRSETTRDRSLFNYARFNDEYETDVFDYWFNKSFRGYIIASSFPDGCESILGLKMPRKIKKPETIKFKSIPLYNLELKNMFDASSGPIDEDRVNYRLKTSSLFYQVSDMTYYGTDIAIKFNIINDCNYPIDFMITIPNEYKLKILKMFYFETTSDLFSV